MFNKSHEYFIFTNEKLTNIGRVMFLEHFFEKSFQID